MSRKSAPPTEVSIDKGTNRAYVWWDGKKVYFGKAGTLESAKKFLEWSRATLPAPEIKDTPQEITTVARCAAAYMVHAQSYYARDGRPTGELNNIRQSMAILLRHYPRELIADFGPKKLLHLQNVLAEEMVTRKGGRGERDENGKPTQTHRFSRETINTHIRRIRRCFRWCVSRELIPVSVVTALETVSGLPAGRGLAKEPSPVSPVSIEDVIATFPFLSPTVVSMIKVQTLSGMRPQDVCRMTPGAIDRSKPVWLYRPAKHKTSHRKKILTKAIPVEAQEIIKPFLIGRSDDEPLFSPSDSKQYWLSLTRNKSTTPKPPKPRRTYNTGAYGKAIVYAIARAAKQTPAITIKHWYPNQLRHLIGTQLRAQIGIEAAQLFLGHAKPDVTLRYAEASDARLAEIAKVLVSPFGTMSGESLPH